MGMARVAPEKTIHHRPAKSHPIRDEPSDERLLCTTTSSKFPFGISIPHIFR
jgi:hypothetical protein